MSERRNETEEEKMVNGRLIHDIITHYNHKSLFCGIKHKIHTSIHTRYNYSQVCEQDETDSVSWTLFHD